MGFWGSEKIRTRSYMSMYDEDTGVLNLAGLASITAGKQGISWYEAFQKEMEKSTYTKIMSLQNWAKKHYVLGNLDSNDVTVQNIVWNSDCQSWLEEQLGEEVEVQDFVNGDFEPIVLVYDQILAQYPDYELNSTFTSGEDIYEFYSASTAKEYTYPNQQGPYKLILTVTFKSGDKSILFKTPVESEYPNNEYLYVTYLDPADTTKWKLYFYDLTVDSLSFPGLVKTLQKAEDVWFPMIPFRLLQQRLDKTDNPDHQKWWKDVKKACAKLGMPASHLIRSLHTKKNDKGETEENEEINKIKGCQLFFGVPVSSKQIACDAYCFEFLGYLMGRQEESQKTLQIGPTTQVIFTPNRLHLQEDSAGFTLYWGKVSKHTETKEFKGKYFKEKFSSTLNNSRNSGLRIYKRTKGNSAICYSVDTIYITDTIWYDTDQQTHRVPDNLYQGSFVQEEGFLFPLHREILKKLPLSYRNQVAVASERFIFDFYDRVSKKWYQSFFVKIFIFIVFRIIDIFTGGTSTAGTTAIEIAIDIAIEVAVTIAISLIANMLAKMIGATAALVFELVVQFYCFNPADSWSKLSLMQKVNFVAGNLMKAVESIHSDIMKNKFENLQSDIDALNQEIEADKKEREEKQVNYSDTLKEYNEMCRKFAQCMYGNGQSFYDMVTEVTAGFEKIENSTNVVETSYNKLINFEEECVMA